MHYFTGACYREMTNSFIAEGLTEERTLRATEKYLSCPLKVALPAVVMAKVGLSSAVLCVHSSAYSALKNVEVRHIITPHTFLCLLITKVLGENLRIADFKLESWQNTRTKKSGFGSGIGIGAPAIRSFGLSQFLNHLSKLFILLWSKCLFPFLFELIIQVLSFCP